MSKEQATQWVINYVLMHELEDYRIQAQSEFESLDDYKARWQSQSHIYVAALIAEGSEPDYESVWGE